MYFNVFVKVGENRLRNNESDNYKKCNENTRNEE